MHQRRQGLVIQEPLPCIEAGHEFRWWRRDVGGVVQRASGRPDPVLAAPELTGRGHVASDAAHETFVHLAYQAQRHGQRIEAFKAVLQGSHVVAYLAQVGGASLHVRARLGGEQLSQGRLGSLDAAGQDGFLVDEGPDQEVGIGQPSPFARKPADSPVGGREVDGEPLVPRHGRGKWGRHMGLISPRDSSPYGHEAGVCVQWLLSHRSLFAETKRVETLIIVYATLRKQALLPSNGTLGWMVFTLTPSLSA